MAHHKIQSCEPGEAEYAIELKAHPIPWSWSVFQASAGDGYYCRRLLSDEKVVGFTISQLVADELTLHNIAVDPAFQRHGFGRALLEDLLAYARENHCIVYLEVRASNRTAIALYERVGFDTVGRRNNYYPIDEGREDALVMRWEHNTK